MCYVGRSIVHLSALPNVAARQTSRTIESAVTEGTWRNGGSIHVIGMDARALRGMDCLGMPRGFR